MRKICECKTMTVMFEEYDLVKLRFILDIYCKLPIEYTAVAEIAFARDLLEVVK